MKKLLFFVLLSVLLVSCSSGSSSPTIDITGTWATTFVNQANNNAQVVLNLQLAQSGNSLSGTALVETEVFGTIKGTRSGNVLTLDIVVDPSIGNQTLSLKTTKLSQNAFSGTYTATGGGFGTISGTRSGSNALQSQAAIDISSYLNTLLESK